jgi:NAD(P)-dependent dehydrogenase (short-subunit alcohol dehydrogenase family)
MLKSEKYFMEPSVGRAGRVEEIANAGAFLASPLAGFINGAICGSIAASPRQSINEVNGGEYHNE